MSVSTSEHSRVERVRLTKAELERLAQEEEEQDSSRGSSSSNRRVPTQRPRQSGPSGVTVDPFNTPAPPTTPSSEPGI